MLSTETQLADILLHESYSLSPEQRLTAGVLLTSLRTFQHLAAHGLPFEQVTPELVVAFIQRGESALKECKVVHDSSAI